MCVNKKQPGMLLQYIFLALVFNIPMDGELSYRLPSMLKGFVSVAANSLVVKLINIIVAIITIILHDQMTSRP